MRRLCLLLREWLLDWLDQGELAHSRSRALKELMAIEWPQREAK